jgi:hypothetical protein
MGGRRLGLGRDDATAGKQQGGCQGEDDATCEGGHKKAWDVSARV